MESIQDLAKKLDQKIADIVMLNGCATQYVNYTHTDGRTWTVRISDHNANPSRCDSNTISLVVILPVVANAEDDVYTPFSVPKKQFSNILHQFNIEDGRDVECGWDLEQLLNYIID